MSLRILAAAAIFAFLAGLSVWAQDETRQVLNGDVLYTAGASALTESGALFLAEGRAIHLLSVECSAPPREAKIYREAVERGPRAFVASVEVGAPIADCEALRRLAPSARKGRVNQALLFRGLQYERMGLRAPASVEPAPIAYHFTAAELEGAHRAFEREVEERLLLRHGVRGR
jgi:hypothetical protein